MTSVEFLQAHLRNTIEGSPFAPNTEKKVLPECQTPSQNNQGAIETLTDEEKTDEVLSDPKFGMFNLWLYHLSKGHKNTILKRKNAVYCSHIFSSIFALPVLVFITQWLMYISVVSHQVRTYEDGFCPQQATIEEKLMMAGVSILYFIKSFFLYDGIVDRTRRKKMMPSDSYVVMLDTLQEFGFNLTVYLTNLWVIFAEKDFLNMFFNTLAMEFLMEMDNEFEKAYFSYLPGVAVDIYDNLFVTYREHSIMVQQRKAKSFAFRCCRRIMWIPFKLLIFLFMILPILCFVFIFYGSICK